MLGQNGFWGSLWGGSVGTHEKRVFWKGVTAPFNQSPQIKECLKTQNHRTEAE